MNKKIKTFILSFSFLTAVFSSFSNATAQNVDERLKNLEKALDELTQQKKALEKELGRKTSDPIGEIAAAAAKETEPLETETPVIVDQDESTLFDSPEALYSAAMRLLRLAKGADQQVYLEKAQKHLERIEKAFPQAKELVDSYFWRAEVHAQKNEFKPALVLYNKFVTSTDKTKRKYFVAWYKMALLLKNANNNKKACQVIAQLNKQKDNMPTDVWRMLELLSAELKC